MTSRLPAGVGVSGVAFDFDFASAGPGPATRASGSRSARAGSSSAHTGPTRTPSAVATAPRRRGRHADSEVTTSDVTNGLAVRVYAWNTKNKRFLVDLAVVTGSTAYGTFTSPPRHDRRHLERNGDDSVERRERRRRRAHDRSAFPTASNSAKYLQLSFDPSVPTGATISSATLTFVWRASGTVASPGLCYASTSCRAPRRSPRTVIVDPVLVHHQRNRGHDRHDLAAGGQQRGQGGCPPWPGSSCGARPAEAGCPKAVVDQGLLTLTYALD